MSLKSRNIVKKSKALPQLHHNNEDLNGIYQQISPAGSPSGNLPTGLEAVKSIAEAVSKVTAIYQSTALTTDVVSPSNMMSQLHGSNISQLNRPQLALSYQTIVSTPYAAVMRQQPVTSQSHTTSSPPASDIRIVQR